MKATPEGKARAAHRKRIYQQGAQAHHDGKLRAANHYPSVDYQSDGYYWNCGWDGAQRAQEAEKAWPAIQQHQDELDPESMLQRIKDLEDTVERLEHRLARLENM